VLLYSNLAAEDAWSVVEALNKQDVPYKFSQNGSAIHVPSKDVYRLRISLAATGLPRASEPGYEIFDRKGGFGISDFVQQVNYQRALEGELARTIADLDGVERARVHLTMPKEALFDEEAAATTASVAVVLAPGTSLDEREIAGITHLVASSVPRLSAERVTIVDASGRILTTPDEGDAGTAAGLTRRELETQRRIEEYLARKTQSLLEGALGAGRAIVKVNAELDFRRVEEMRETYDPENVVIRSEERAEGGGNNPKNAERSVTNYEMNRSVQKILGSTGAVKRLSVAAFIDGRWAAPEGIARNAEPTYTPRSVQEMANLTALVQTTVGYDPARGDRVELVNVPFERSVAAAAEDGEGAVAGGPAWTRAARGVLARATPFLLLVAVLLFLRRSVGQVASSLASRREGPESLPSQRPIDAAQARRVEVRARVEKLAIDRPAEVAALIRTWMSED
jgi:flagellar M-ring protein FliF